MKKSIYDLALETVNPDGGELTENQENEVDALVQFGKRVLENSRLPTKRTPDRLAGGVRKHPARAIKQIRKLLVKHGGR